MAFFRPIIQRQRWGDDQLPAHTDWGNIFFDLFYVAAAYNLGSLLREDPSRRGLLYLTGCFLPILNLWNYKMGFLARFRIPHDVYHRVFEVMYLIPLATAVTHIHHVPILSDPERHLDMFVFCCSITLAGAMYLIVLVEVMISQRMGAKELYPESWYMAQKLIWISAVPTLLALCATVYTGKMYFDSSKKQAVYNASSGTGDFNGTSNVTGDVPHLRDLASSESHEYNGGAEDDVAIWLLIGSSFANIATMGFIFLGNRWWKPSVPTTDSQKYTVPMNIEFSIHRYGEWTMLLLGESILSLLIVDLSEGVQYYEIFFCGVITVVFLEYLHFRSQPSEANDHALRRSASSAMVFFMFMQVYSIALVVLGTSYKMFLYESVYADESAGTKSRALLPMFERFLAGKSTASRFETGDRQQRIAHFFSGSLALVWTCLDAMSIAHRGVKSNLHRLEGKRGKKIARFLLLLRTVLIVFIGTLSLYVTSPVYLAFTGLGGVVAQILLRFLGSAIFFVDDEFHEEETIEKIATYANARLTESGRE
jgi:low temperature requirement protein LtrA